LQVVQVWDASANTYKPVTEEQAGAINEDASLLPALITAGAARVYLRAPDLDAAKLIMGYVMGKHASATEQRMIAQVEELREHHQLLGRIIRDVLTAGQRARVAAELERVGVVDQGAEPAV
jgi:hypothetical protein